MKTYLEFFDFWKRFPIEFLQELRKEVCQDGKSRINSIKLEAIDDLCYLKKYNLDT